MDRDDGICRHQFQTSLDQQFFRERIADLNCGPFGLGILAKIGAGHSCAVNAIAPSFGPDIDDGVAHAGGGGIENFVLIRDAHGHRIDEDIAVIGGVEIGFAANCRYTHAIAIAADPGDYALHQMLHLGMIGPSKPQRIGIRHRTSAHGEDIAQYAANTRCCALIGLNVGWVVVALHLEDRGLIVANVDNASILARTTNDPRGLGRQFLQMEARGFVAAMFRPHDREDAQLNHIGFTAQRFQDLAVFFGREAVLFDDFWGDLRCVACHALRLSDAGNPSLAPSVLVPPVIPNPARKQGRNCECGKCLEVKRHVRRLGCWAKPIDCLERQ